VAVTDLISGDYISSPEYSINDGSTWSAWTHSLNIGTLVGGGTTSILIKGNVLANVTGAIPGTASVASPVADPSPSDNTSVISTPVTSNANLALTAICNTNPVIAGGPIQYAITVTNSGPGDALNVSLTDAVPASISDVEYSLDNGSAWLTWTSPNVLGSLPAGNSLSMLIRGTVSTSLADGTVLANTVSVSSSTPDPETANNSATVSTTVTVSADLTVNLTDSPDPALAGLDLTYTLAVANNGPSDALGVSVADVIPAALGTVQYSLDNGSTWAAWTSPYLKGALPAGASFSMLIRGVINSNVDHGTRMSNTATVSATTADAVTTNNSDTEFTKVNARADLSITKTDSPDPVIAGKPLTYTITVLNSGPSDARNVTVTDLIPASINSVEYSSDNGSSWNAWTSPYTYGTLTNGGSFVLLIRGVVNSNLADGAQINNTAKVSSTTADLILVNNSTTQSTQINAIADLSITKTGTPDPAIAGQRLTYTITVSNAGPSDARLVTITDAVPASLSNIEYSPNSGSSWLPWTGSYTNGTLPVGNSLALLVRGMINTDVAGGTVISNTAVVSSATSDPAPANNSQTVTTTVNASADLSIIVAGSLPVAGSQVTYTLTVFNIGPSDAQAVTLADNLSTPSPFNAGTLEYSDNNGSTWNTWTGSLNAGSLTARNTYTLLVRGTLSNGYSGSTLSNTASVSGTTADPDAANNTYTIEEPLSSAADLSIVKTCNTTSVVAGQPIEYKLLVSNAGPGDASEVTVTDYMESSVISSPEYSINNGLTWTTWTNTLNIGTLANGASATVLIRGNVAARVVSSLKNSASVTSAVADPDLSNNSSTITTVLTSSAGLYLSKICNTAQVVAGEIIQYTINVGNAGPSDALSVIVTDEVPAVITDVEYSLNNGASWISWTGSLNHGTLPAGNSISMLIRGIVNPDVPYGDLISNTATVGSSTPRSIAGEGGGSGIVLKLKSGNSGNDISATANSRVSTRADLVFMNASNPDPVIAGQNLTYTITVTNDGPSDAQDVSVANNLPVGLSLVSSSPATGIFDNTKWTVGTLAAGQSTTLILVAKVSMTIADGSVLVNTSRVNSTTYDPLFGNNLSSETTRVYSSGDLSISKTATPDPVIAGNQITYTITVSNSGPSDALGVKVADPVPAAVLNPQWSTNGGTTWNTWVSPYDYGTLASGAGFSFLIRGTVDPTLTAATGLSNSATVTTTTVDPDPRNNTATFISTFAACPAAPVAVNVTVDYDGLTHAGSATVGAGETVDWYTAATGGTPTSAPAAINPGVYSAWAEGRNTTSGCVSSVRTQVTLTINSVKPIITSALSAGSIYGTGSTYQILATNSPTSFSATGLPAGMTVSTSTGLISISANAQAGIYNLTIGATNQSGTTNATVVYTVGKLSVTALITAMSKCYDGTTAVTLISKTLQGVISPDVVSLSVGAVSFSDPAAGNGKTVTATGLSLTGADIGNYALSSTTAITYADISALPATSGITGNSSLNCRATGIVYSVELTQGSSYLWTVPAGATIMAGATGPNNNQITVNFGLVGGFITVTETNTTACTGNTRSLYVGVVSCLPDLVAEIEISPVVIAGITDIDIIVKVSEINMVNTNGIITVVIPKDSRLTLNSGFDPSLTEMLSTPLNNGNWTYSSNASYHIFTTTSVITAGNRSVFGFRATFNPGNTKGVASITSQILSGSGGEVRTDNNVDSKKLEYTDR
jgi:uncharacterized repeat protein (TIGR01451 family)